jgi:hypothetical protein
VGALGNPFYMCIVIEFAITGAINYENSLENIGGNRLKELGTKNSDIYWTMHTFFTFIL